jgi:F-type H+-transporting ATPase subunit b
MELITPGFGLIFWQAITFLVVLFILGKFAWKPIMSAIEEREASIENALASAERAKAEMQQLQANNEALLKEARLERDKMLSDAQASGSALIAEAKERATIEANKIIESAKATIQTEKQAAITELKNQVATLSIDIAEKIIKAKLSTEQAQKDLVRQYIQESNLN